MEAKLQGKRRATSGTRESSSRTGTRTFETKRQQSFVHHAMWKQTASTNPQLCGAKNKQNESPFDGLKPAPADATPMRYRASGAADLERPYESGYIGNYKAHNPDGMTQDLAISSPDGRTPGHGPSKPRHFIHFVAEEGGEENLQHPAKKHCGNTLRRLLQQNPNIQIQSTQQKYQQQLTWRPRNRTKPSEKIKNGVWTLPSMQVRSSDSCIQKFFSVVLTSFLPGYDLRPAPVLCVKVQMHGPKGLKNPNMFDSSKNSWYC